MTTTGRRGMGENTGHRSWLIRCCLAAAVAGPGLTGCTGTPADKAGGDTVVLRLASIDGINPNGLAYGPQAFVDSLASISGGRIRVEVREQYGDGAADAESRLVRAIASGEIDGGWPATRAFGGAGLAGLDAVEAPLTITSYAAQKELVSGPVADTLMRRLDGTGVLGLGLAVGPLRRPFVADTVLLGPPDWRGAQFRVFNSRVQTDTVTALGGVPRNLGFEWIDQVTSGALRGTEFDLGQYAKNGYATQAGNVSANVVLWPKAYVLSLSRKRFDSLTAQQQGWVRDAAATAVKASVEATFDESAIARELCTRGVRFHDASPAQLEALRKTVRPVLARIGGTPADAAVLEEIQAIGSRHPRPEPLEVPAECRQGISTAAALGPIPSTPSDLPEGVYRVALTLRDIAGHGNDSGLSGTWTLRVRGGTYELSCRPLVEPGVDCGHNTYDGPLDVGDLRGTGHTVYFIYRPDVLAKLTGCTLPPSQSRKGACFNGPPYAMDWALDGDRLTFTEYRSEWTNLQYILKPWQKIA